MIEKIKINGFKSLKNVSLEIKPLTVLIGLNSSGKSSILHLLGVLKQSVIIYVERGQPRYVQDNRLKINGWLINLGSYNDIIYQKKRRNKIQIEIEGAREQFLDPPFSKETTYDYSFTVDNQGLNDSTCEIRSGEISIKGKYRRGAPQKDFNVSLDKGTLILRAGQTIGYPVEYVGTSGEVSISIHPKVLEVIRDDLSEFFLVPAIRGVSSPSYNLAENSSNDLIDSNNLHAQAIKFSSTVVYEGTAIERKINKWIKGITGVTVRGRTVPTRRASIEVSRKIRTNIINDGFGTNQLVHLFAQIAKAPPSSLIGIEEPETHLHPKAQSDLARVLVNITKEEKKNLVLTTHSEHILYRLLIEVAKGNLTPDTLAIYHFRLSDEGETMVEKLSVDEKGRLEKGIPDFLETDLGEFKDFLEALKSD